MEEKIRLNLGCGDEKLEGYISCDVDIDNPNADMVFDAKKIPFPDNSVDEIRAYHLIEHFTFKEGLKVIQEWFRALKPGGILVVETPDFLSTCKRFIEADDAGKVDLYGHFFAYPDLSPYQTHYFLFTEDQLGWSMQMAGFVSMERLPPDSTYAKQNLEKPDLYLKMVGYKPNKENI